MSIIERDNPLNLQFNVCVVTNASSALGVVICKTLLKANALVLGLDTRPKDSSLNAGLGTHFQFEDCDVKDEKTLERVFEAVKDRYGFERIDVLVNLVEEEQLRDLEGIGKLSRFVGMIMEHEGKGSIVNLFNSVEATQDQCKPLSELTNQMTSWYPKSVRCNTIAPESPGTSDLQSSKAYTEAKAHMTALMKTEKNADVPNSSESKKQPAKFYDVGNLALFLASGMSEDIAGAVVRLDGSYSTMP